MSQHQELGTCPHCDRTDGVERYEGTSARYCHHCQTRWLGRRSPVTMPPHEHVEPRAVDVDHPASRQLRELIFTRDC